MKWTKNLFCADGRVDGGYLWSSIFLNLNYINNDVMKLLNIGKKFVTNLLMSLKFWCQVGDFGFDFQKFYGEMYFWKNMLWVRCFKTSMDSRHFLNFFFQNLVKSWGVGVWFTRAAIGLGSKIWGFDTFCLHWFLKECPFSKPYCG